MEVSVVVGSAVVTAEVVVLSSLFVWDEVEEGVVDALDDVVVVVGGIVVVVVVVAVGGVVNGVVDTVLRTMS